MRAGGRRDCTAQANQEHTILTGLENSVGGTRPRVRGAVGLLTVFVVLLAGGCASSGPATGTGSSAARSSRSDRGVSESFPGPVAIPGVAGCSTIRQRASQAAGWSTIVLPCLTSPRSVSLGRLGGRPGLVNLWASWCPPCRKEMPVLQRGARQYRDRVQFIGINTKDGLAGAEQFLRELKVTYPQLADPGGKVLAQQRIPGLPVTLLIGADGSLVKRQVGALDEAGLEAFLRPVLRARAGG